MEFGQFRGKDRLVASQERESLGEYVEVNAKSLKLEYTKILLSGEDSYPGNRTLVVRRSLVVS